MYEDERLLVLDKPAGVAVHGGSGISFGVIEALRAARPDETLELVHRLDRDTSGCLLVARRRSALRACTRCCAKTQFEKRYLVLVRGKWELGQKLIDAPLRTDTRVGGERTVQCARERQGGAHRIPPGRAVRRSAPRCWRRRCRPGARTRSACMRRTAGHPVAGDDKYGDADFNEQLRELGLTRMFLHAHSCAFAWPGGSEVSLSAPLPAELKALLDQLAGHRSGRRAPGRRGARPQGSAQPSARSAAASRISGRPISPVGSLLSTRSNSVTPSASLRKPPAQSQGRSRST